MDSVNMQIERRFVSTAFGRIHVAMAGAGQAVLLLHQTPRSWDEFRDVIPRLAQQRQVIAMDTPGFGDSEPLPAGSASIENWALAAGALLDALGIGNVSVVGHHTGAVIALELAATTSRVRNLILSACPYVDAARRLAHGAMPVIDETVLALDGTHLVDLWGRRQPHYPPDVSLMHRFMIDALRAGPLAAEGHRIVNRYRMEDRLGALTCRTLIVAPTRDPNAGAAARLRDAIAMSRVQEVVGAMVPFPDSMPERFAEIVESFITQDEARP